MRLFNTFSALATLFILLNASTGISQTVTNGNFAASGTGWGCSPETNPQSTYGGTGTNRCAEIDAAAGLCQTISGFTAGAIYRLTFVGSRRTGGCPGPNPATINVVVDGGALTTTATRTNTTFGYTTETILFTATATSHTLTISAAFGGTTCGFIIDDIAIALFSPLPVEFGGLNSTCVSNKNVEFNWYTYSEINNDYFSLKKSANAVEWIDVTQIDGSGNSNVTNSYSFTVNDFDATFPYYSLSQTDFDGTTKVLQTIYLNCNENDNSNLNISQTGNNLEVELPNESEGNFNVFSATGQIVYSGKKEAYQNLNINLSGWSKGIYFLNFQNTLTFRQETVKFYIQ